MANSFSRILLIGAGQLGSRYLQGLSSIGRASEILVVDPNLDALSLAKQRFEEMPANSHVQSVMYHQDMTELDGEFDLAIIATNADVRKKIVDSLLTNNNIKYLILEKVVFQSIDDFETTIQLLKGRKIRSWVNCPRRAVPFFRTLRKDILRQHTISMNLRGSNWGIGSNTIHILDLLAFLSGQVEFLFDITQLDNRLYDSKRPGFIELAGRLTAVSRRGDTLDLYDDRKSNDPPTLIIECGGRRLDIDEQRGIVITSSRDGSVLNERKFTFPMQSEMTSRVVSQILAKGSSCLTPLEESFILHRSMLKAFNRHLSNVLQKPVEVCSIT